MPRSFLVDNLAALRTAGVDAPAALSAERPARLVQHEADGSLRLRTRDARVVRLESARNPRAEADALVDAALAGAAGQTVAIVGVGSGALLDAVFARGLRALVLEFDLELAAVWLARHTWSEPIAANRLRVIVGPDYVGAAAAARFLEGVERLPVIAHPVLVREYPDDMAAARHALDRVVRDALANANARERFEDLALINTLSNLPALAAGADAASLFGRFPGFPAVVIGAGPSLDENLAALREVQDRALVIAADTALLPCLKAGVVPQLVVALDPSAFNGRHLIACAAATETHLVTELSIDPAGVAAFAGRTFVFRVGDHAPWPWLLDAGVGRGHLAVWGSVATAALDLALKAGCASVAFAGLDLAYTGGRPYCRGTVFEELWARAVADGQTLEEHWQAMRTSRPLVDEPDVRGRPTQSANHLLAFRDWIREVAASHPSVAFANTTAAGVLHGGRIVQRTLPDVLRDAPVVGRAALTSTVEAAYAGSVDRSLGRRLAVKLAQARPLAIVRGHSAADRAAEALVTRERLTETHRELEAAAPVASSAPMTATFAAAARIHLPEQTSALAALTSGTPPRPEHSDLEGAAARLRDAYDRLVGLVGRVHGVPALLAVDDLLAQWQRVPARLLFDWPAGLVDEIEAFGATLSEAIRLAGSSAPLPDVARLPAGESVQGERAIDRTRGLLPASDAQLAAATLIWQWTLAHALTTGGDPWLTRAAVTLLWAPPGLLPSQRPATRLTAWLDGHGSHLRFLPGLSTVRAISGLVASDSTPSRDQSRDWGLRVSLSEEDDSGLAVVCAIEPDSLLARGYPRAHLVVALSDDEVLVGRSDGSGIAVMSESGELVRVEAWPLPVRASIPLRGHGRLAWHFPDAPRLLHRDGVTGEVEVIELPVGVFDALERPDGGAWLATDDGLWTWAPGGSGAPLVRGPWLASLCRKGDGVRACARPARDEDGRWDATTAILEWQPGDRSFRVVPVTAGTAPFAVAERAGWRAEAWLDGCVVRLVRADGRVFWLACSGPRSLAWAGASLYVATTAGEMLRFANVADRLAAL